MARTTKRQMLINLSDRCLKKSFRVEGGDINIYDEMFKLQTILNESEEVQEAIHQWISQQMYECNYTKEENQKMMEVLYMNDYLSDEDVSFEHEDISLEKLKQFFPSENITKEKLIEWAKLDQDVRINGTVLRVSAFGKVLVVRFIKGIKICTYKRRIT